MKKRLRKKIAKQQKQRAERVHQLGEALGPIFADEILLELQRPSSLSGTEEEFLEWDNLRHPHWTRTSWGSRPLRGILQVVKSDEP